jgi:undecaprenyl-diphosphatase
MLEQILQYDRDLFLFLNNLGSPAWDNFWLIITNKLTFIPLYAVLLFLVYKKLGLRMSLMLTVIIVLMITFTDQVTNLFKDGFARSRPCRAEGLEDLIRFIAVRCGKYGFFSGHAANSMAAAVFAGLLLKPYYKNLIFLLLLWSAIVAYSRIYVGVHYPLDIFFGMMFGSLSGFLFYKLQGYLKKKFIS